MERNFEELVYSENVIGFTALATEFCNLLDGVALMSQKDFIDKSHRLLPLIYLKAIILPEVEAEMPEMIDKEVTQEEWEAVYKTMANKLVGVDAYQEVFDSLIDDEQMSSLSEGFADIYQDLKDFVLLYNMGTAEIMNDAIWECKKNFKEYWGQRLVNITRVLHHLLYGGVSLNEKDALSQEDFDPEKWEKKDSDDTIGLN
ncbi:MAG: DUF5063 domain-containing protein [Salinivirgaceae bacterium]|jgi:hypothetical protein|nr:DUF5063 domain-containing protein [Salinivirgaceae bacterium]